MNFFDTLRQRAANLLAPKAKNSAGLARDFLRYGRADRMVGDWSQVVMDDRDLYTGYSYAAIRNRANSVARIAGDYLRTDAKKEIMVAAKKKEEAVIHPYLEIIDSSPTFSNRQFWSSISTFLDLEGVYYLMAIRAINGERYGEIQQFKLLNPYNIRRIINPETLKVEGYVETRGGLTREIGPNMIIEMRELNPFDEDQPFAMTDAAKETQFTLKTMGDYTRHALKGNINAPGILTTDVILPQQDFDNFKARVVNHTKGEPIFGNGSGAITYNNMQTDLDKASLQNLNEINRDALLAVTGVSKTILGIEQSGTTRDTAETQQELHIESQILPRIGLIIDALNQDYKNHYPTDYEKSKFIICVDNPLGSDHDAEIKEVEFRQKQLDLYDALIAKGYDPATAGKYAVGEMEIDDLGEPINEPKELMPPATPPATPPAMNPDGTPMVETPTQQSHLPAVHNQITDEQQGLVNNQQGALRNAVVNIQESLVLAVINKVTKNSFESEDDIVSKSEKKQAERDLALALAAFYTVIFPLYGTTVMNRRASEFGLMGLFAFTKEAKEYIKANAAKVATSHIETILSDLLVAVREAALQGASQQEIISAIRQKYSSTISASRAEAIARTETNRAFTQAQFEADKLFVIQNELTGRAFKKWVTRSGNPCAFCQALAQEPPIPFDVNFRNLGDEMTVTLEENGKLKVQKMAFEFAALEAGNAHVNCACIYQLIIE